MPDRLTMVSPTEKIRRVRRRLSAVSLSTIALALTLMVSACGGSSDDDGTAADVTEADKQVIVDVIGSFAQVVQTAAPVLTCYPASTCDPARIEQLRREADGVALRLAAKVTDISAPCLRSAMQSYVASIRGYHAYARAVASGREGFDALDASDASAWKAARRLEACGYVNRGESIGLETNLAYQRVNRAVLGIEDCKSESCYVQKGKAIERAASVGIERVEAMLPDVDSQCVRTVATTALSLLRTWEHYGRAATRVDGEAMNRDIDSVTRLYSTLGRQSQECVAGGASGG